jgi:hypothetical protein
MAQKINIGSFLGRNYLWIALIALIAIGVFYAFFSAPYWNTSIMWRDLNNDNLQFELNPVKLLKNDRKIKNLLASQIEKEDPLFMGPELNDKEYQAAVENFNNVNDLLKKELQLPESSLPINFLTQTVKLDSAKRTLVTEKSYDSLESLMQEYKKTNRAYLDDARHLKRLVEGSNIDNKYFAQVGAVTSKEIILDDINSIINNGKLLDREISDRLWCLKVSPLFCKRSVLANKVEKIEKPESEKDLGIMAPEKLASLKDESKLSYQGPYAIYSGCWNKEFDGTKHLVYVVEDTTTEYTKYLPVFANNIYYQSITPENKGPFLYKQFAKKGIEWEVTNMFTSYICNDLEYQADLGTLNKYIKTYPGKISGLIGGEEARVRVIDSESAFYGAEIKDYVDLYNLGIAYRNLYRDIILSEKGASNRDSKVAELKEALLIRSQYILGRESALPEIINYQTYLLSMYSQTNGLKLREKPTDTEGYNSYFYTMRNSYSINMLSFTPYTMRREKLRYINADQSRVREDMKDYAQMLSDFGAEAVRKINESNRNRIVNDAIEVPIR